jgi:spore germination protein YaaH
LKNKNIGGTKMKQKITLGRTKDNKKKIKKILIIIIAIILIGTIAYNISNNIIVDKNKSINLVINNKNVTSNLKKEIIIENDNIYISKQDLGNFFDKYIYEDTENNNIVTTYNNKIASISLEKNKININGSTKNTYAHAENKEGTIYVPITELEDVYGIEIKYLPDSKVLTIDSTSKEQKKGIITKNVSVKSSTKFISKTIDKVKKGSYVIVVSEDKGYTKIRTENGKVGYVKTNKVANTVVVREEMQETKQIEGKVNMVWDYYSEVASAPDRTGVTMDGVNVVSPAFFHLNTSGELTENVGTQGQAYIDWAHSNGYKVWPMVQNAGNGMLNVTSNIMNDYNKRQKLINQIVNYCVKYKLDGINIDFENMKKEDKDMYSRFIIELAPRLKDMGIVVSVDVTAPDGSETWSLCFDRNVIGDVADYIIFMAYDQYGTSSNKSGTTAGYDWVNLSLNKFLKTEEIESNKIILAIPLYTRLWTEDSSGKVVKQSTVSMKNIDSILPGGVNKQWDDNLKQYYVEYQDGQYTKKMWIEDEKSLKEKINLINSNNLGGVASWEKGMETDNFWTFLKENLDF